MDIDGIIFLIFAWRFVLCCVAFGTVGFLLGQVLPSLSPFHMLGITLLGLVAGARWQSSSRFSEWRNLQPHFQTPPVAVAFVASVVCAAWGYCNARSLHDLAIGLVVFGVSAFAWRWHLVREGLLSNFANVCVLISCVALICGIAFSCFMY